MNRCNATGTTIRIVGVRLAVTWLLLIVTLAAGDNLRERRQRLAEMSPSEKQELLEKFARFNELPESEKERLRELYAEIHRQPDSQQLLGVLRRYSQWLKSLSPADRANLVSLADQERLAQIQSIKQQQEERAFRQLAGDSLTDEDRKTIRKWFDDFVQEHRPTLTAKVPQEMAERMSDEWLRRMLAFSLFRNGYFGRPRGGDGRGGPPGPPPPPDDSVPTPTAEDEAELVKGLSAKAHRFLDRIATSEEKSQALRMWISWCVFSRPMVDRETLNEFAMNELDAESRARLEIMPRDRMYDELRRLYDEHHRRNGRGRGYGSRSRGRGDDGGRPSSGQPSGDGRGGGQNRAKDGSANESSNDSASQSKPSHDHADDEASKNSDPANQAEESPKKNEPE